MYNHVYSTKEVWIDINKVNIWIRLSSDLLVTNNKYKCFNLRFINKYIRRCTRIFDIKKRYNLLYN